MRIGTGVGIGDRVFSEFAGRMDVNLSDRRNLCGFCGAHSPGCFTDEVANSKRSYYSAFRC